MLLASSVAWYSSTAAQTLRPVHCLLWSHWSAGCDRLSSFFSMLRNVHNSHVKVEDKVLISACSWHFVERSMLTVMTTRLPFVPGGFQSAWILQVSGEGASMVSGLCVSLQQGPLEAVHALDCVYTCSLLVLFRVLKSCFYFPSLSVVSFLWFILYTITIKCNVSPRLYFVFHPSDVRSSWLQAPLASASHFPMRLCYLNCVEFDRN